jgi:predicted glycosyltransferase
VTGAETSWRADVLFHVQHLLGIGHLNRAAVIAQALSKAGLKTVFATGGMPVAGLEVGSAEIVQLPPARVANESFELLDRDGRPVTDSWRAARRERLLELYRARRPKLILTELFPFGRRQMRFELLPLLDAAIADRPSVKVVCSLRDILNAKASPAKVAWMLETFETYYDAAIVHGDPAFLPLEASFPEARKIGAKLTYSGYVTARDPGPPARIGAGSGEVIVSTGGGAVAEPLIAAALEARPLSPLASVPWRILVGPNLAMEKFDRIAAGAPDGVEVERARPDFRALLSRCRLSISQAGYNTVMDILTSGAAAVVVPFAAGTETEQGQRAALLAGKGLLTVVNESGLTGESLARGIAAALERGRPAEDLRPACDGARETTAEVLRLVRSVIG